MKFNNSNITVMLFCAYLAFLSTLSIIYFLNT